METKPHKEIFSNIVYLLLFFFVVFISTASVVSLNPRTAQEIGGKGKSGEAVKGLSTFDTRAIKYENIVGVLNGIKLENYERERDGGYLSRIVISDTRLTDIEQNIIMIVNSSLTPKSSKIIFRIDPNFLQTYTFWGLINGYYVPLQFNQYGYFEKNVTFELNSENMIGLRIYSKDSSVVKNIGVEMEIIED